MNGDSVPDHSGRTVNQNATRAAESVIQRAIRHNGLREPNPEWDVRDDELVGKTIASVQTKSMRGRDLHYGDEVSWEEVTLTFTDGTSLAHSLSSVEVDADTISETDRVCPSCNRSFDKPNDDCCLEDVHWRERYAKLTRRVVVLAGHRQSGDSPDTFGPFDDFAAAREFVIEQVRDGDWDPDGVAIEFSPLGN